MRRPASGEDTPAHSLKQPVGGERDPGWSLRSRLWEATLRRIGFQRIAGIDEAGRGALAGPVVAAAVVLPADFPADGIDDSKRLSPAQRDAAYARLVAGGAAVGVGIVGNDEIDRINILEATKRAMLQAVSALRPAPEFLLTDAVVLDGALPLWALIKGDRRVLSIAAASIVAKVTRDRLMADYHRRDPRYNFILHKGYATSEHLTLLRAFGRCAIHRRSFRPVLNLRPATGVPPSVHAD